MTSFTGSRAGYDSCALRWFGRMLCYGSPRPRHMAGFRLELCCDMAVMWYAYMCVFGYVRRFEPSGVMLCVAPASEWWPRSWALHDFVCIMYIWFWYTFGYIVRHFSPLYPVCFQLWSIFLYYMLYILSTSFVLTPFLRGLRFMPAGTDAGDPPL